MNPNRNRFFTLGEKLAQNPCSLTGCPGDFPNPDPFVIRFLGTYYCYSTADAGVNVSISQDLVHWEYQGFALESPGDHGFWAPSVLYREGRFYMYYSSCRGEEFEWMRVASAEHPLGPFHFEKNLSSCFSIDTHAVRGADGEYYLFYCTDNACGNRLTRPGTAILIDQMPDPLTLKGQPRLVLSPTIDQEISGKGAISPRIDWHTVEGVFYLPHGKKEYLMYSGNSFEREDYFIGYACPDQECSLQSKSWYKYPKQNTDSPFCRKTKQVEGTGHNSVTKAPNLVDDWCVYHARLSGTGSVAGRERRLLFTDRILWNRDEMWLAGPTCEERNAPARPGFADCFGDGLGHWEQISGNWIIENGTARQKELSVPARLRLKSPFRNFVMETWVRTSLQPHGSLLGVSLYSPEDSLEFLLHEGLRQAQVIRLRNGARLLEKTVPLGQDYAPFAWHCIRLEKSGDCVRFLLDGFQLTEASCSQGELFPELYTQLCQGEFAAFSLTTFLTAEGEQLTKFLTCESDSGIFEGSSRGITYFTNHSATGKLICKEPVPENYEASLDIYPAGVCETSLWLLEITDHTTVELPLTSPAGHTLHIRVYNGQADVLLDYTSIYSGPAIGISRLALKVNACIRIARLEVTDLGLPSHICERNNIL